MPHYTVDSLLEILLKKTIVGANKDFPNEITVEGNVSQVRIYDEFSYFNLKGAGRKISVRCPKSLAPNEGRDIVFKGTVSYKTDNYISGISIFLTGRPEGSYTPIFEKRVLAYDDYENKEHTPLLELMSHLKDQSIIIIGTNVAHNDIKAVIGETFFRIDYEVVAVSNKHKLKTFLTELKENNRYQAIVLTRGGDEASMAEIWDDPLIIKILLDFKIPYYTALGHADSVTLADKFASEMFITPTDFGHALRNHIDDYERTMDMIDLSLNRAERIVEKDADLEALNKKIKYLKVQFNDQKIVLNNIISKKTTSYYKMLIFTIFLISIIGLGIFYFVKSGNIDIASFF